MRIGILTGGGDVPGLNTVIRDITYRACKEQGDFQVIGIRRGWGGLVYMNPNNKELDQKHALLLTEGLVRRIDREGGTFLHTSRVNPLEVKADADLKEFRRMEFEGKRNMTPEILKNLNNLGINILVVIGGDDTLSYALHLTKLGFPVIGIPKTMDGDVAGTDYCIGFSTAITKANEDITELRSCFGSHERIGVVEIFGRYSGFTGLYTALASKPDRVVIPEVEFDIEKLTRFLIDDRKRNPSRYSMVIASEGSKLSGIREVYEDERKDMYGHKKLGGIGKTISDYIEKETQIGTMLERLRYLLRCGPPDARDKIVASVFANLAFDLILKREFSKLTAIKNGKYYTVPLEETANSPKKVDVERFYDAKEYRPNYQNLEGSVVLL